MDEIEKLKKIIQDHEDRISKLENQATEETKSKQIKGKSKYSGSSGGVQLVIDNGFLVSPKTATEVYEELKKEGYYKPQKNVDGVLRNVFVKNQILERFKDDKVWKYVIRK